MAKKPSVGDQIESGLQEQAGSTTENQGRPIIPEVEAKIDAWIKQNPERHQEVVEMGLDWLVRREIHRKIKREEAISREADQIFEILDRDQALAQRVEDKIRNVPEERKERARFYVARDLMAMDALSQALKAKTPSPTP